MPSLPISNVRQDLFGLVKQVNDDHDPLTVVTKSGENAVLLAESDWNSIMETLYVLQTHGGPQLLASAEDARAGRTEAHTLIDPEGDLDQASFEPEPPPGNSVGRMLRFEHEDLRAYLEHHDRAKIYAIAPYTDDGLAAREFAQRPDIARFEGGSGPWLIVVTDCVRCERPEAESAMDSANRHRSGA